MNVAFDLTPAVMSGAGTGRYPRELLAALQRREDVRVDATSSAPAAPRGVAGRNAQGVVREGLYYPLLLGRRARAAGADLVHCPAAFAPRVGRLPLVLTIHDVLPFRYPELFPRVVVAYSRATWQGAARRAARVITGTEHSRRELIELLGVPPPRVAVTPYGADARFHPRDVDRAWLAERFGFDRRFVLCVGTLEPRKNLVTALRAFARVAERVDDCLLAIAGGRGWHNDAFERQLAGMSDRVRLTGFVSDEELAQLYAAADCFVFPSLYEGYGLPVLEAMASGTPVVTSDVTSLPEVAGDAAICVPPKDTEAVAAAIERILSEPQVAADFARRGLERARAMTWDACAEATVGVYREVA